MRPITQAEQARWQREAVLALTEILDEHRTLPVVEWRVQDTRKLIIAIGSLSDDPIADYEAWRDALGLSGEKVMRDNVEDWRFCSGTWVTARGGHRVDVVLHVTVRLPEDEAVR